MAPPVPSNAGRGTPIPYRASPVPRERTQVTTAAVATEASRVDSSSNRIDQADAAVADSAVSKAPRALLAQNALTHECGNGDMLNNDEYDPLTIPTPADQPKLAHRETCVQLSPVSVMTVSQRLQVHSPVITLEGAECQQNEYPSLIPSSSKVVPNLTQALPTRTDVYDDLRQHSRNNGRQKGTWCTRCPDVP